MCCWPFVCFCLSLSGHSLRCSHLYHIAHFALAVIVFIHARCLRMILSKARLVFGRLEGSSKELSSCRLYLSFISAGHRIQRYSADPSPLTATLTLVMFTLSNQMKPSLSAGWSLDRKHRWLGLFDRVDYSGGLRLWKIMDRSQILLECGGRHFPQIIAWYVNGCN